MATNGAFQGGEEGGTHHLIVEEGSHTLLVCLLPIELSQQEALICQVPRSVRRKAGTFLCFSSQTLLSQGYFCDSRTGYTHMTSLFWFLWVPGPPSIQECISPFCLSVCLPRVDARTLGVLYGPLFPLLGLPTPVSKPMHYCLSLVQGPKGRPLGSDILIFHHSNQGFTNCRH